MYIIIFYLNKMLKPGSNIVLTEQEKILVERKRYIAFLRFVMTKYNKHNKTKYADIFKKPPSVEL